MLEQPCRSKAVTGVITSARAVTLKIGRKRKFSLTGSSLQTRSCEVRSVRNEAVVLTLSFH